MGDTASLHQEDIRRNKLQTARDSVDVLPCQEAFELAGRPNLFYELRDYAQPNRVDGAKQARSDIPYLFKSFETGQARPPRPGTKYAQLPRAATIHEYLDWTVTAQGAAAQDELVTLLPIAAASGTSLRMQPNAYVRQMCLIYDSDMQDFSGFRTIVIVPRFRPHNPAPGAFHEDYPKRFHGLGAPKNPWPRLMNEGKPVCAATVRVSLGYMEVCP